MHRSLSRLSACAALALLMGAVSAPLPVQATESAGAELILRRGDEAVIEAEKLLREEKYSDALVLLEEALARNVRNTDAHVYSAIAWMQLGNLDKAKSSVNNAIGIDVGHMGAYVIAGEIALKERNLQQAEYFLGALKVLCQAKCPEYYALDKMIREYKG